MKISRREIPLQDVLEAKELDYLDQFIYLICQVYRISHILQSVCEMICRLRIKKRGECKMQGIVTEISKMQISWCW